MYHALEADMINLYYPKSFVRRVKAAFPNDDILHALLDSGSKDEVGAHLRELERQRIIQTSFYLEWQQWVGVTEESPAR